ncbi:MAG: sigma-70 family RNA polymerase sigma factor [Treponema sp.]|nr:sigma-70 family RNA polymerase sigma factor [Treponema sp.]
MERTPLFSLEQLIARHRDNSLVKSALSGDKKAFERLCALHGKRISALAKNFFKREEDRDDFVQEVFMKAYMKLSSFRGASSFGTWITAVAYNLAVNSVTRHAEYVPLSDEELLEGRNLSPEEELVKKLTVQAVREAVGGLPEKYGICLDLYFFHDLSYEEIGKVTGFPLNTIKSHVFRGKKLLHEKLRWIK